MKFIFLYILLIQSSFAIKSKVNGFVNLAYTGSNSTTPYNSNVTNSGGFTSDSSAGLSFHTKLKNNFHSHFLFLLKNITQRKEFKLNLSQAFISYIYENKIIASFGKLYLPIWNYSDHKNVGTLYPWMNPPEEVYSIFKGDDVLGLSFEHRKRFNFLYNSFQMVAGTMQTSIFQPRKIVNGLQTETDIHYNGPVISLNDTLKYKNLLFRLSYSHLKLNADINNRALSSLNGVQVVTSTFLKLPRLRFDFYSLGLKYRKRNFNLQSEVAQGIVAVDKTKNRLRNQFGSFFSAGLRFKEFSTNLTVGHQVFTRYTAPSIPTSTTGQYRLNSLALVCTYSFTSTILTKLQIKNTKLFNGQGQNSSSLIGHSISNKERIITYGASLNAMF